MHASKFKQYDRYGATGRHIPSITCVYADLFSDSLALTEHSASAEVSEVRGSEDWCEAGCSTEAGALFITQRVVRMRLLVLRLTTRRLCVWRHRAPGLKGAHAQLRDHLQVLKLRLEHIIRRLALQERCVPRQRRPTGEVRAVPRDWRRRRRLLRRSEHSSLCTDAG